MALGSVAGLGSLMALFAGILVFVLVLFIVFYIYMALALMAIAKRTGTPNGWLAWIPIANFYLMADIAKVPWWTMFAFLLVFVPFVGGPAFLAVTIWWWWKIAEARGKPGWWGILMLIPIVNLVVMGMLAWGK